MKSGVMCAHCGKRAATCVGRYDSMRVFEPACDECCQHGCEDGRCWPIDSETGRAIAIDRGWIS